MSQENVIVLPKILSAISITPLGRVGREQRIATVQKRDFVGKEEKRISN